MVDPRKGRTRLKIPGDRRVILGAGHRDRAIATCANAGHAVVMLEGSNDTAALNIKQHGRVIGKPKQREAGVTTERDIEDPRLHAPKPKRLACVCVPQHQGVFVGGHRPAAVGRESRRDQRSSQILSMRPVVEALAFAQTPKTDAVMNRTDHRLPGIVAQGPGVDAAHGHVEPLYGRGGLVAAHKRRREHQNE